MLPYNGSQLMYFPLECDIGRTAQQRYSSRCTGIAPRTNIKPGWSARFSRSLRRGPFLLCRSPGYRDPSYDFHFYRPLLW